MTDTVRYLNKADRINALYQQHDNSQIDNVVTLNPPLCPRVIGMMDDVQALLQDPQTRPIAESVLRDALKIIAQNVIGKPK